jgi:hypothetical protein
MNETAYNNWIHEQLEPGDKIIVGKKDHRTPNFALVQTMQAEEIKNLQWEEEDNAKQDAYLRRYGAG